jgi:hypothetical protein
VPPATQPRDLKRCPTASLSAFQHSPWKERCCQSPAPLTSEGIPEQVAACSVQETMYAHTDAPAPDPHRISPRRCFAKRRPFDQRRIHSRQFCMQAEFRILTTIGAPCAAAEAACRTMNPRLVDNALLCTRSSFGCYPLANEPKTGSEAHPLCERHAS